MLASSDWLVAASEAEVRQRLGEDAERDPDVLDTWFR